MIRAAGNETAISGATTAMIVVFLLAYIPPGTINIGPLTMGFPRLVLTLTTVPATLILLSNPRYRLTAVDGFVLAFAVWATLSIIVNHGTTRIQFAGLQFVETFGAYALGRIMLAEVGAYSFFWRSFGALMLFMLPIGLIELLAERFVLHMIFDPFIQTFENQTVGYRRWGFIRVHGNLEHAILFGVFWGFGLVHFLSVYKKPLTRVLMVAACLVMTAISLSSGAYLAAMIQLALILWGLLTRDRWNVLIVIAAIAFIIVEILSDRPAIIAISTRLAFSAQTAYWRVLIFEYGMQNIWSNPLFGLGLRDWVRPVYLTSSVDNQWLLTAMRSGIPAFVFQMAAIGAMLIRLIRRKDLSPQVALYRKNYIISFVGLFLALGTVAVWSGTQAFLWVLLAMGVNLSLAPPGTGSAEAPSRPDTISKPLVFARSGPVGPSGIPSAVLPFSRSRRELNLTTPQGGRSRHEPNAK